METAKSFVAQQPSPSNWPQNIKQKKTGDEMKKTKTQQNREYRDMYKLLSIEDGKIYTQDDRIEL